MYCCARRGHHIRQSTMPPINGARGEVPDTSSNPSEPLSVKEDVEAG
jgi:hypothetical protein